MVNTDKGNLVITVCAHPGLAKIIDEATQLGRIYGVLGVFHDFSKLKKLRGIKIIAPCHCTQHIKQIRQSYPAEFKEIRAGTIIEV